MENLLSPKFERFFNKLKYSEANTSGHTKTDNLIKKARAAAKVIEKEDAQLTTRP